VPEAYSAATGSSSGSSGSVWLSAFSHGAVGAAKLSRRKSTIKSRKQSTGTEYILSAVEYFVRNEITILSSAAEYLSALNATILTGSRCSTFSVIVSASLAPEEAIGTMWKTAGSGGIPRPKAAQAFLTASSADVDWPCRRSDRVKVRCPLLAQGRRAAYIILCPLVSEKRTLKLVRMSALPPEKHS
jgi:hypothetical protein